jgi:hypothetical protein
MGAQCAKQSRYFRATICPIIVLSCINVYDKTVDKILDSCCINADTKKTSEPYNNDKPVTSARLDDNIATESTKKDTSNVITVTIKSDESTGSDSSLDNHDISINTISNTKIPHHPDDDDYVVC